MSVATETRREDVKLRLQTKFHSVTQSVTLMKLPPPPPKFPSNVTSYSFHFDPSSIQEEYLQKPTKVEKFEEVFYDTPSGLFVRSDIWISNRFNDDTSEWLIKVVNKEGNVLQVTKFTVPEADEIRLGDEVHAMTGIDRREIPQGARRFESGVGPQHYLQAFGFSTTIRHYYDRLRVDWGTISNDEGQGKFIFQVATIEDREMDGVMTQLADIIVVADDMPSHVPGKAAVAAVKFRQEWTQNLNIAPHESCIVPHAPPGPLSEAEESDDRSDCDLSSDSSFW